MSDKISYDQLPWPKPFNQYYDDGAECTIELFGHRFEIKATDETGVHSGRTRWRVSCLTCNDLIHRGSTSAKAQLEMHLWEKDQVK